MTSPMPLGSQPPTWSMRQLFQNSFRSSPAKTKQSKPFTCSCASFGILVSLSLSLTLLYIPIYYKNVYEEHPHEEHPHSSQSIFPWWWGLIYFFMLITSSCTATAQYLKQKTDPAALQTYIDDLRGTKMRVFASVECYHTESRTTGSGKNRKTKTVTIVTFRGSREFEYESCKDRSPSSVAGGKFSVIRVDSSASHIYGTTETHTAAQALKDALVAENRHRDRKIRSSLHHTLDGIISRQLLFFSDPANNSANDYMTTKHYWMATALGGSFLYQVWFMSRVGQVTLKFEKKLNLRQAEMTTAAPFTANAMPIAHVNYGPIIEVQAWVVEE